MSSRYRYVPRHAFDRIQEALEDTRIVVVNGARQVGKSTLAANVLREHPGATAQYLDDPGTRAAAVEDPVWFIRDDKLMLIDEVQRVPDLWLAIKHLVDRDPRPGRFLLTGSARLLALRQLPDSLPGRSETIELWPLSQGEIDGTPDDFIDSVFGAGVDIEVPTTQLRRKDYVDRASRGGYPEAVARKSTRRRDLFFDGYLADILNRDVKQVADIARVNEMRRLINLLAGTTAGLLNKRRLANDVQLAAATVSDYVEILETIFLVRTIPGWAANATTRAVSTPKIIFTDTGFAAHLLKGLTTRAVEGNLLENFVLGELARQLTWSESFARLFHYRDRDGYEVDAIIENNAGQVIGIEVKASETIRSDDFKGLRVLRNRLGSRFHAGFVLSCGTEKRRFGDRLAAAPISSLWTASASGVAERSN